MTKQQKEKLDNLYKFSEENYIAPNEEEKIRKKKSKEREKAIINEKTCNFLTAAFTEIAEKGLDKTLNKKRLKELYKKYCES